MTEPRYLAFRWAAPLVALDLLMVVLVPVNGPHTNKLVEYLTIGVVIGSFFATPTLAAAWTAFGPLAFRVRLVLSLGWVVGLLLAFTIKVAGDVGWRPQAVIVVIIGGCMLGQWAVALVPLGALAVAFGLRLQHASERDIALQRSQRQFGIRQLLIVTAIVAAVMGIGRLIVMRIIEHGEFRQGEAFVFVFLAAAGIVMTLPLMLAALLPRWAVPASILILALIGLGTFVELPLLSLVSRASKGPDAGHVFALNGIQAAWVLAVIAALRAGGFQLVPTGGSPRGALAKAATIDGRDGPASAP